MQKNVTILFVSLSAILILDTMNAWHAFAMFLLAGIIPGTNTTIDADHMLQYILLISGFTLARITTSLVRAYSSHQRSTTHASNGTMLSAHS